MAIGLMVSATMTGSNSTVAQEADDPDSDAMLRPTYDTVDGARPVQDPDNLVADQNASPFNGSEPLDIATVPASRESTTADNTAGQSRTRRGRQTNTPVTGSISSTDSGGNPRVRRQDPVRTLGEDGQFDTRGNTREAPIEGGGSTTDTDPYAALGIRLGTFDLFPTLEQSIGYTTNADYTQNGDKAGFSETTAGLRLQSDWSRHSFSAELGATYQRFFSGEAEALPTANADAALRLDIGSQHAFTLRGGYDFTTESADSSNLATGSTATIASRPAVEGVTGSAEIARTEGKLRYSLRGSLDKTLYEDADLSDGTILLQADRNNLLAMGTIRLSYQISPAVTPFVEGSFGKRIYDLKVDGNGNRRDSNLYALRGGLELNFGEKLNGQFAVGYTAEDFKDASISTLKALTLDGSINWSPVRLTTVTATASTSLSPSATIDDNGSVIYTANLGISRQVRPQLTLDANLTGTIQDYDSTGRRDVTLGANAGYTYWFNRFVAATGRVSYQNVESTTAGSSYDVGTVRFGLRLQR